MSHPPNRAVRPGRELARRFAIAGRQAARLLAWATRPGDFPRPQHAAGPPLPHRVWERRVSIGREDAAADPRLEAGKRLNLALVAPAFDGLVVSPDRPLSFWRAVGPLTEARGFQWGLSLRGGCLVPALGGGVCLLSNALFAMAAHLGWTILERHGHSMEAVPLAEGATWGLDATVAYPHVDLRIAPTHGRARLGCRVSGDDLLLTVDADAEAPEGLEVVASATEVGTTADGLVRTGTLVRRRRTPTGQWLGVEVLGRDRKRVLVGAELERSCLTCGEVTCAARVVPPSLTRGGQP